MTNPLSILPIARACDLSKENEALLQEWYYRLALDPHKWSTILETAYDFANDHYPDPDDRVNWWLSFSAWVRGGPSPQYLSLEDIFASVREWVADVYEDDLFLVVLQYMAKYQQKTNECVSAWEPITEAFLKAKTEIDSSSKLCSFTAGCWEYFGQFSFEEMLLTR